MAVKLVAGVAVGLLGLILLGKKSGILYNFSKVKFGGFFFSPFLFCAISYDAIFAVMQLEKTDFDPGGSLLRAYYLGTAGTGFVQLKHTFPRVRASCAHINR